MSYQELPVQMHPRYQEFLAFVYGLETDARKNQNALELAFNVWINAQSSYSQDLRDLAIFSSEQAIEIKILKNDLDRLHRERDSFQEQARVLAEEVERLNGLFLAGFNHAVGERGHACMSVDNGNL